MYAAPAIERVRFMACSSCSVEILDMKDESAQQKAKQYGVTRVPSIVVNGTLADCCQGGAINPDSLRALGVGSPA